MLKVIAMNCPNCGAHLDVTSDLETFACAYCGSTIKVTRHGGTVSLVRIEQAIGGIKTSTERIAAELALKRLKHELGGVTADIMSAEFDLQQARSDLKPLKTFDVSYPLKISGTYDWCATPRHEFVALIKWAVIAIVLGMMLGFVAFAIAITISWFGVLASRRARVRVIEESNSRSMRAQESIQSRLYALREQAASIEKQVQEQRTIVEV